MYVAFDDTDSTSSMCTTFLATEVVRALHGLDLIGLPRLVRLNPAVPWKTRGNGALVLRFGAGQGRAKKIGRIDERDVLCFHSLKEEADAGEVLRTCSRLIDRWARTQEDASPGLVVSRSPPSPRLYWQAVRGIVEKEAVEEELRRIGASTYQLAGGRGIIGAAAAMSWRPRDRTYEALVYRRKEAWGTTRAVEAQDVERLDALFPTTFNNYDREAGRTAIVPHSTCPILFGVRGDDPGEVMRAAASIRSEPKDRWLLFLSNQGTDDHIIPRPSELRPWSSYLVRGEVLGPARTIAGGHVIFSLQTSGGEVLDCAAYEPSKGFRDVVRRLMPGDAIEVVGELRETPRTLNLEKLHVLRLAEQRAKPPHPVCPRCGKSMGSMGRGAGYRCKRCRARSEAAVGKAVERDLRTGWYEPPVCARRHISKPLKRMATS